MPLLTMKKRVALASSGLFAASLSILPFAGSASAAVKAPARSIGDNAAVNVQTEYDCNTHSITADVTNKLATDITPSVVFNQFTPEDPGQLPAGGNLPQSPIKPGEHRRYLYNYSGNNLLMPVKVSVDGYTDVTLDPMLNCQEPVSFKVTDYSEKMVTGYLTNNNTAYPQSVTIIGPDGQRQDVTLEKGRGAEIAISFDGASDLQGVSFMISNGPNYQSSYFVDMTQPLPTPPMAIK